MSNREDELLEEEYKESDSLDNDYLYDDNEPTHDENLEGEVSQPSMGNAASPSSTSAEKNEPYKANKNEPVSKNTTPNESENRNRPQANRSSIKNSKQPINNNFKGKKSLAELGAKGNPSASGESGDVAGEAVSSNPITGGKVNQVIEDKTKEVAKNAVKNMIKKNPYMWGAAVVVGILLFLIIIMCASGGAAGGDEDSESANTSYGNIAVKNLCNEVTVNFSDTETSEVYDLEDYVVLKLLEEIGNEDVEPSEDTIYLPTDDIKAASIYIRTVIVNELKDNNTCTLTLPSKENYDEELVDVVNIGVGNTRGLVMMSGSNYYIDAELPNLDIFDEHDIEDEIEQESKTKKEIVSDILDIDEDDFELKQIFSELSTNTLAMDMNYNTLCNTTTIDANVITYINGWENHEGYCDGGMGYNATNVGDRTITAGYGVTNIALNDLTNYINEKGYGKYFNVSSSGTYYMKDGDCIPVTVIDNLKYASIEQLFYPAIESWQVNNPDLVLTQYQKDAILTFNYNLGPGYTDSLLNAYKERGYEGLWEKMSKYVYYQNSDGEMVESAGLKKRRKGEFALFVTGDYTDQGLFYGRGLDNYDDFNSEGVIEREAVCQISDAAGLQIDESTGYIMRLSRPLRDNEIFYDQSTSEQLAYSDFEGECAWYAGYRAQEILKQTKSSKTWTHMPDGKEYCSTPEATSGDFQTSKDVNQPKQGALISWSNGNWGHVAVVEKVNEDGSITVSEGSIGYGSVADRKTLHSMYPQYGDKLARKMNCEGNNSGCFNLKTIPKEKISDGFVCYIYLLD